MEGVMVKMAEGQVNTRHFFLFNDAIIYVQVKRKKYVFKGKWELSSSWIKDIPDSPSKFLFFDPKKWIEGAIIPCTVANY